MGDHRRGAMVDVDAGHQRLELDHLLMAGIDLRGCCAAAGSGRRMEIHRVDHAAVGGILEVHFNRVADAHAQERSRHFAVERPVAKRRAFREPAFQLDGDQINADGLRRALANGRRQVGRFARDDRFDDGLRRRSWRYQKLPFHAGKLMAWHAAQVGEVSGAFGAKRKRCAGAARP